MKSKSSYIQPLSVQSGAESPSLTTQHTVTPSYTYDLEQSYLLLLHDLQEKLAGLKNLAEQQALEKAQIINSNNSFLSIIAHDLRGPLASILGVMSLMKEYLYSAEKKELEEYIEIASSSALITSNLLENLLAWAVGNRVGMVVTKQQIVLHDLVNEQFENWLLTIKLKRITLINNTDPNLRICADEQMIKTVFRNLINNATKFTRHGGQIEVLARKADAFVEVTVRDNGKGIPQEELQELFNIDINQSKVYSKQKGKGRGIGLTLCKEFIDLHGGHIRVQSTVGKGSEFIFTLPLYTPECAYHS
jgi:signal transduction histidine kinase